MSSPRPPRLTDNQWLALILVLAIGLAFIVPT